MTAEPLPDPDKGSEPEPGRKPDEPFKLPSITESLKADYERGTLTLQEVAEELYRANLLPFIDRDKAATLIGVEPEPEQLSIF